MPTCTKIFEDLEIAGDYAKYRPAYPETILTSVMEHLREPREFDSEVEYQLPLAVDVGCGTGHQSTYGLAKYFEKVIGTDTSAAQIETARKSIHPNNIEFIVSEGENMTFLDAGSVSLITCGTALHWLDALQFYRECNRVLAPGGVVASYCYNPVAVEVIDHPNAIQLSIMIEEMMDKALGDDEKGQVGLRHYTDDCVQIPYPDYVCERIDGMMKVSTTLAGFLGYCRSLGMKTLMKKTNFEKRLTDALGSTDSETSLMYHFPVYMLMGRKP